MPEQNEQDTREDIDKKEKGKQGERQQELRAPGLTTRSKKLLRVPGIATSSILTI